MEEVKGRVINLQMVVEKGKFRGMRGALHKLAGENDAYRLQSVLDAVYYGHTVETSTDIVMDLYFLDISERTKFIAEVKKTLRIPEYLRKCAPDYKPKVKSKTRYFDIFVSDLVTLSEEELSSPGGSIDYDRAYQDLGSYTSSTSQQSSPLSGAKRPPPKSGRSSPPVPSFNSGTTRSSARPEEPRTTPLFEYQTLEDPGAIAIPYRLHLIPKRMKPAENSNNYLAGSWSLHQLLDGLNLIDGIPALVVEYVKWDGTSVEAVDGVRYKVLVRIKFRDEEKYKVMQDQLRDRLKRDSDVLEDGSVETFVQVTDVAQFRTCLIIKKSLTEGSWGCTEDFV